MKLIPMTDFVLEDEIKHLESGSYTKLMPDGKHLEKVRKYAKFLKQPLKLEMFVPCDKKGNVLKQPFYREYERLDNSAKVYEDKVDEFCKAKEKVLFEGFKLTNKRSLEVYNRKLDCGYIFKHMSGGTIESSCRYGVTLTSSAIKQIGL